jgi:hypothetical protein
MLEVQVAERLAVASASDGTVAKFRLPPIPQALQGKAVSVYVTVHLTDANTRLRVGWAHGPQSSIRLGPDVSGWVAEGSYLWDSSTAVSAPNTYGPSTTTDISRVSLLGPVLEILATTGSTQVKATVSIWIVLKAV